MTLLFSQTGKMTKRGESFDVCALAAGDAQFADDSRASLARVPIGKAEVQVETHQVLTLGFESTCVSTS